MLVNSSRTLSNHELTAQYLLESRQLYADVADESGNELPQVRTTRAEGGLKLVIVVGSVLAILACAGLWPQRLKVGRIDSTSGLHSDVQPCLDAELKMDFGSGTAAIKLHAGKGSITMLCPTGSLNASGQVVAECLPTGMWTVRRHTCFDCPAGIDLFRYEGGHEREVRLQPGLAGHYHKEPCEFNDGTNYAWGSVLFKCVGKDWIPDKTTCSPHKCQSGNISLNFYGKVGKVHFPVQSGHGSISLPCPKDAPLPTGTVDLNCGDVSEGKDIAQWRFVRQTCQVCNPTSMILTVDKVHKKAISLPGGNMHSLQRLDCKFDNGTKEYKFGELSYKCYSSGWKLYQSSCADWVCPNEMATINMQYTMHGETMTGRSQIHLKRSGAGTFEYKCPQGSPDPDGALVFDCQTDGSWKIKSVNCGTGVEASTWND